MTAQIDGVRSRKDGGGGIRTHTHAHLLLPLFITLFYITQLQTVMHKYTNLAPPQKSFLNLFIFSYLSILNSHTHTDSSSCLQGFWLLSVGATRSTARVRWRWQIQIGSISNAVYWLELNVSVWASHCQPLYHSTEYIYHSLGRVTDRQNGWFFNYFPLLNEE